jgi:exonuclease III
VDEFVSFVNGLQFKFAIIVVTETWANNINESNFVISGYNYCGKPRIGSRGGGVAIYVKDGLNYTIRSDLDALMIDVCELISIQLSNDNITRNIVAVYRPPGGNLTNFNNSYCTLLDKLNAEKCETYITGDFNVNLLNSEVHQETASFLNMCFEHNQCPAITKPTHFCNTTSTLIDNIFINKHDHDYNAGLLITDLSDHLPIFYISPNRTNNRKVKKIYKSIRDLSDHAVQKLHNKLIAVDWNVLDNINDVNVCYDTFAQTFESAYNQCLPVKTAKVQIHNNSYKPWITNGKKVNKTEG